MGVIVLADIVDLLNLNLARVQNLISIYGPPRQGRRSVQETDVLRAALVMLHASMEDFLRSLLKWRVPALGAKELIDTYPLPGSGHKQARNFLLGSLVAHKGKTVDQLIEAAAKEYLDEYASFNDLGEVKRALTNCGLNGAAVENHGYGELPAMIARRHKIVHHADRNEVQGGQGNHRTASIGTRELNNYVAAVQSLRDFVQAQLG